MRCGLRWQSHVALLDGLQHYKKQCVLGGLLLLLGSVSSCIRLADLLRSDAAHQAGGPRRLAVSSTSFSLEASAGSSLQNISASSRAVSVYAGPSYMSLTISGVDLSTCSCTAAKLVRANAWDCAQAAAEAPAPLDGSTRPDVQSTTENKFSGVTFTNAGRYRLCYLAAADSDWQVLPPIINVIGGSTDSLQICSATSQSGCEVRISGMWLSPTFALGMVPSDGTSSCGMSPLVNDSFATTLPAPPTSSSGTTSQIYDLGMPVSATSETYLLCLCPAYSANNAGGLCTAQEDFVQTIGKLALTTVTPSSTIYPGLPFAMTIDSGTGVGGFSTDYSARYKIIKQEAPSSSSNGGRAVKACQRALEADVHDAPRNCQGPTICAHNPIVNNGLATTWEGITLGSQPETGQISSVTFDVCFCNTNCWVRGQWENAGSITVMPVAVQGPGAVGASANVVLSAPTGAFTTSGDSGVREMKLLPDEANMVDRHACYGTLQSNRLARHSCGDLTDCTPPVSGTGTQTWAGIQIWVPGHVAVCYCDRRCENERYWNVMGRLQVAGPDAEQSWLIYAQLPSQVIVRGSGLSQGNVLKIIAKGDSCATGAAIAQPSPSTATQDSGSAGSISRLAWHEPGKARLTFAQVQQGVIAGSQLRFASITCPTCTTSELAAFNGEHKVIERLSSTDFVVPSVLAGDTMNSFPSPVTSGASWYRSDQQTFLGIQVPNREDYKVCWASSGASGYVDIGTLSGLSPVQFPATVNLMTHAPGVSAPVVIGFTTGSSRLYAETDGAMRLRVVFSETSSLLPRFSDDSVISADTSVDEFAEASQSVCGRWIVDVDTDAAQGFPRPKGCYFGRYGATGWEFNMVFLARNGFAPSQTYEIIFKGVTGAGLPEGVELAQVWILDDFVRRPYLALGIGHAISLQNTSLTQVAGDPAFNQAEGFRILGGSGSLLEFTASSQDVSATLAARSGYDIPGGTLLKVFLQPVFQWHVGATCQVTCTPYTGRTCGSPTCVSEPLTELSGTNVLWIGLPSGMTPITNSIRHTINMLSLPVPIGGFFPQHWSAQVQTIEKADYVQNTGFIPYAKPLGGIASIVATDGNSAPFQAETGNTIYVRMAVATSVFAAVAGDVTWTVKLPPSYSCTSVTHAPDSLSVLPELAPTGRGELSSSWSSTSDGCAYTPVAGEALWAGSSVYIALNVNNPSMPLPADDAANIWTLQLSAKGSHSNALASDETQFAGVGHDFVPSVSVLGALTRELIQPSVFARGEESMLSIFFAVQQGVEVGGFIGVDAPLRFDFGEVCEVSLLPDSYYIDYDEGLGAGRRVTKPLPLSSQGVPCRGHQRRGEDGYPHARVVVGDPGLRASPGGGSFYGFQLYVRNAFSFRASQRSSWFIQTYTPRGAMLDASRHSVKYLASGSGSAASWGTVDVAIPTESFGATLSSTVPNMQTEITILPIVLSVSTRGRMRVIAPPGYIWRFTPSEFVHRRWAPNLKEGEYVPDVEEDMPLGAVPSAPGVEPFNILDLGPAVQPYLSYTVYGFRTLAILPSWAPVDAPNVFIVEVGVNEMTAGITSQAGVTEAPLLQRVQGAIVRAVPSLAGLNSTISIGFQTVSDIPPGGGIIAAVAWPRRPDLDFNRSNSSSSVEDSNSTEEEDLIDPMPVEQDFDELLVNCTLHSWNARDEDPAAYMCQAMIMPMALESSSFPYVRVWLATAVTLPAGAFDVRLEVTLPTDPGPTPAWWIETYSSIDSLTVLDSAGMAQGFEITVPMDSAELITGSTCFVQDTSTCSLIDRQYLESGRNDHPGEANNLIFAFKLSSAIDSGSFIIRAPMGFQWPRQCVVVTKPEAVFDNRTNATSTLPAGYGSWPSVSAPVNCRGRDNVAVFDVPYPGLDDNQTYIFRINGVVNPLVPPQPNLWSIEFGNQSSVPMPGFPLFTFSDVSVAPRDRGAGASNRVAIAFAPYRTLTYGGRVELRAPRGYAIPQTCGDLEIERGDKALTQVFVAVDFSCEGVQDPDTFADTNVAIVTVIQKELLAGDTYVFRLTLTNVVVPSEEITAWEVRTYQQIPWIDIVATYQLLDSGIIPGFEVVLPLETFRLEEPPSSNGLAEVQWKVGLTFNEDLFSSDILILEAPAGFDLEDPQRPGHCSSTSVISGPLSPSGMVCSHPCYLRSTCRKGRLTWTLWPCRSYAGPAPEVDGLCVSRGEFLVLGVATKNPNELSTDKFMTISHLTYQHEVRSMRALDAYEVVPLLADVSINLVPGTLGVSSRAITALTVVNIVFVPLTAARTVVIQGMTVAESAVGSGGVVDTSAGVSFEFSACTPVDGFSGGAYSVNLRTSTQIIFTRSTMVPGRQVSINLNNIRNPPTEGAAFWNISTYEEYNIVVGPRFKRNEVFNSASFPVVGFIDVRVQPISFLSTYVWGSSGVTATLIFRSSSDRLTRGVRFEVTPPANYEFEASNFQLTGRVHAETIEVSGMPPQASGLGGVYVIRDAAVDLRLPTLPKRVSYQQQGGSNYLYWRAEESRWVISRTLDAPVTGASGQAYVEMQIPAGARKSVYIPAVAQQTTGWKIGSSSGWQDATAVTIRGQGALASSNTVLSFVAAVTVSVEEDMGLACTLKLPGSLDVISVAGIAQVERNWLFNIYDADGQFTMASNDKRFGGFQLVYPVQLSNGNFEITPRVKAPGALTRLTVRFDQLNSITAQLIRYRLHAPSGFTFPANCLSTFENGGGVFSDCVGGAQQANLQTQQDIQASGITMHVQVNLATSTPTSANEWRLELLLDTSEVVLGSGTTPGFDITPMSAVLRSNNQRSQFGLGFFTFTPQNEVAATYTIRLYAPPQAGYRVSCYGLERMTLPALPACTEVIGFDNELIELEVGRVLDAGVAYMVGVPISNAEKTIPSAINLWRIDVIEGGGGISDSTRTIQGANLKSTAARVTNRLVAGASTGVWIIPFSVTGAIPGMATIRVTIPPRARIESVADIEVPSTLLAPDGTISINAEGTQAQIPANSAGVPVGDYNLQFTVSSFTPATGMDDTWVFEVLDPSTDLLYQQVLLPP